MHTVIDQHRTRILAIAKRHGIREVRVFGSMARGDADDAYVADQRIIMRRLQLSEYAISL